MTDNEISRFAARLQHLSWGAVMMSQHVGQPGHSGRCRDQHRGSRQQLPADDGAGCLAYRAGGGGGASGRGSSAVQRCGAEGSAEHGRGGDRRQHRRQRAQLGLPSRDRHRKCFAGRTLTEVSPHSPSAQDAAIALRDP
jgi:hypothetical protein